VGGWPSSRDALESDTRQVAPSWLHYGKADTVPRR
jgi:hypothetical protein